MDEAILKKSLVELIRRASCDLPPGVTRAIRRAAKGERKGSTAEKVLRTICDNIALARDKSQPICQDTGTLTFYVCMPAGCDTRVFRRIADRAVARATGLGCLRQNSVDPLSGAVSKNNLAPGTPVYHFQPWGRKTIEVRLMLKGGGCENVGTQYSLPDDSLGAGRDIDGARKCILDAVLRAQGRGCAPGVLGVCIGGDRASGYAASKRQFLRPLDDRNPDGPLAALERSVLAKANILGIGPMGLGGKATLLDVKVGALNRVPASYFVTVSYMCWAFRRRGIIVGHTGKIARWLY